jgi:hypothetical protein
MLQWYLVCRCIVKCWITLILCSYLRILMRTALTACSCISSNIPIINTLVGAPSEVVYQRSGLYLQHFEIIWFTCIRLQATSILQTKYLLNPTNAKCRKFWPYANPVMQSKTFNSSQSLFFFLTAYDMFVASFPKATRGLKPTSYKGALLSTLLYASQMNMGVVEGYEWNVLPWPIWWYCVSMCFIVMEEPASRNQHFRLLCSCHILQTSQNCHIEILIVWPSGANS